MLKTQKKTKRGLLGVLIACAVVTVLYIVAGIVFAFTAGGTGDPDLKDFGAVFTYQFKCLGELLNFTYGDGSLGYFALSVFLYALPICRVIFLVAAVITAERQKRRVMWWAVAAVFLDLIVYAVFASGMLKYTKIITGEGVFAGQTLLLIVTWAIIGLGLLHFVLAMLSYFWAIVESYTNPRIEAQEEERPESLGEEKEEEPQEEPSAAEKEEEPKNPPLKAAPKKKKGRAYIVQNFYRGRPASSQKKQVSEK